MKKNTKKLTWANASFRHPCCGGFGNNPKDAPHKDNCPKKLNKVVIKTPRSKKGGGGGRKLVLFRGVMMTREEILRAPRLSPSDYRPGK